MRHASHQALPGYTPGQVLTDLCDECEQSGERPWEAIARLDPPTFARAWERAVTWNMTGLPDLSHAEAETLRTLWAIAIQLERIGWPVGVLPQPGGQVPAW